MIQAIDNRPTIYIASKTAHAPRWIALRAAGERIISTWIDEAGNGDTLDWNSLWERCIQEASEADVLILYREPGEVLKGAWAELGAALASDAWVFAVGIEEFSISKYRVISHFRSFDEALKEAQKPFYAMKNGD